MKERKGEEREGEMEMEGYCQREVVILGVYIRGGIEGLYLVFFSGGFTFGIVNLCQ